MSDSSDAPGGPVLTTARLRLTPYRRGDVDDLLGLFTDPGFRRWILDDRVVERSFVEDEVRAVEASFRDSGWGQWCIRPLRGGRLLGMVGFRVFHEPPRLELLYGLRTDERGNGYATEAARRVMRYGFESLGFERIIASTDAPNEASVEVMKRLGMEFLDRGPIDGLDTITYAAVRAEPSGPGMPSRPA